MRSTKSQWKTIIYLVWVKLKDRDSFWNPLNEVCLVRIKEQVCEKRSTVCSHMPDFVLTGLFRSMTIAINDVLMSLYLQSYRSVTIVIYHILMCLYRQDYINPWLLQFIVYWCLCTYKTILIRDYCNASCIDVILLAGLYRSVNCNLSCIDIFVLARLYWSVTIVMHRLLISLYWQDCIDPWLVIYHLLISLYWQDYVDSLLF